MTHKVTVDCLFPSASGGVGNVVVAKDSLPVTASPGDDFVQGCSALKPLVRGTVLRMFVEQTTGDVSYTARLGVTRLAPYTGGVVNQPTVTSFLTMATTNTFDEGTLEFTWGESDGLVLTHNWLMTSLKIETAIGQGTSVAVVTGELRRNGSMIASVASNPVSGLNNTVAVGVNVTAGDTMTLAIDDIVDPIGEFRVLAFGSTTDTVPVNVSELTIPWNPYV